MQEAGRWLTLVNLKLGQPFKMKYKDAVKQAMETLAQDPRTIFLGYNTRYANKAYGTLNDVPEEKIIETPLAENLMAGLGIGMSLEGFLPIVYFERHDFLLNAADAIVNHLDKIGPMSFGEFQTPAIIRAVVGHNVPINPGAQHLQDFTRAFREMVQMPIYEPLTSGEVSEVYSRLLNTTTPAMVVERLVLYDQDFD